MTDDPTFDTSTFDALPTRDHALGAALRDLPAPEHAPGFFDSLQTKLEAESSLEAAAGAAFPSRAPEVPAAESFAPPAVGGAVVPLRRRQWRRQSLRIAVLAAAAGVIGVAVGVNLDGPSSLSPGPGGSPPVVALPATAVEVAQKVQAALSSVENLRGTLVFRDVDGEVRSRFAVTDDGDFRQSGITRREELAYDASTGVERSYFIDPTGPDFGGERRGISPGPPDEGPATWVLQRELGSTVRALLAPNSGRPDTELTVTATTYDGREAWQLDTDVEPNKIGGGGDHLAITVDQETGYPVQVVETISGEFFRELRLTDLVANSGEIPRSEFTIEFPPGVELSRFDAGWKRLDSLDRVPARVGYAPLVPSGDALPEGFELRQISVVDKAGGTGNEGLNPRTREAVSLAYHRGLDRILVTTRLRGPIVDGREPGSAPGQCTECLGDSSWSDPLASGEGFFDDPEELTVSTGALAGSPAQLLIGPRTTPHVWALGSSLVVTVSGDATREDQLAILGSLQPHSA
ncbi:MAG TPA: hypothetical protein VNB94_00420 [Mycobacteriales bacterium]|nr:hypothetical protein [Mycobacteriales bacterium]